MFQARTLALARAKLAVQRTAVVDVLIRPVLKAKVRHLPRALPLTSRVTRYIIILVTCPTSTEKSGLGRAAGTGNLCVGRVGRVFQRPPPSEARVRCRTQMDRDGCKRGEASPLHPSAIMEAEEPYASASGPVHPGPAGSRRLPA
jgi:hypothetical protein